MKTTRYFDTVVKVKHSEVRDEWIDQVLTSPLRHEAQPDGRIRFWCRIVENGNRALRVVTLADGETVHNAFFDRGFKG